MDSPVQPVTPTAGPTGFEDLIPKKKGAQGPSVGGSTGFDDLIPAKPGILSQIGHGLEQSYSAIRHPEQTVSALVHGIKQSAEDAITPAVGERNTMGGSPGALAVTGFDKQGNPTYNSQVITKENTPGAITKGEKLRGEVNTLANIALPGVGGEATGHLINAGLGAINDPEQPIRGATAGLIIGGLLHAPKMLHGAADVSEGMVPRDLGSDAKYQEQVNPIERLSPNRRPLYTLPENQRPPVEPPPEAEAQSFGGRTGRRIINPADQPEAPAPPVEPPPEAEAKTFGNTPLTDLTDEQKALRARLALEHGIPPEAIDDITRRAMNVKPPVEPREDATTQSFGGRVGRRPAGEVVPPESPTAGFDDLIPPETKTRPVPVVDTDKLPTNGSDDQETPTGQLGTPVSYDALGKLDDVHPRLEPIVSSNGNFDVRPGVLAKVNKALASNGTIATLKPGESVTNDVENARAALLKRYNTTADGTIDMDSPKPIEQPTPQQSAADVATATTPQIRSRVPKVDLFEDSRTENGRLRPLNRISDDALIRELRDLDEKTADAHARNQYNYTVDENFHSTEDGRTVMSATRIGGKGVSEQAKAAQNLRDYARIRQAIYDELGKRGHDEGAVTDKLMAQMKLDEAIEREGMQHADDNAAANEAFGDNNFDFGENASPAGAGAGGAGRASETALASTPKNVSADELINRSKLDLDPEGEKAFQAETERAKAEGLDKTKVTFETQRAAANEFAKSINMDPTTLDPLKTARLSGAQIVGLKNVLSKNLNDMGAVSKKLADPDISVEDAEKLNDHLDGLRKQNDALMSKIVSETSEKGRDLGFLRQMSNATLDPDVWAIQARKVAGRMLSDDEIATVQGLAKAAADACAGGA